MTAEEAIRRIEHHMVAHHVGEYPHIHIGDALNLAIDALREYEYRNRVPLTQAELRKMNGEEVYCLDLNSKVTVNAPKVGLIYVSNDRNVLEARGATLYRSWPENE